MTGSTKGLERKYRTEGMVIAVSVWRAEGGCGESEGSGEGQEQRQG